jgi:hypothetical protein
MVQLLINHLITKTYVRREAKRLTSVWVGWIVRDPEKQKERRKNLGPRSGTDHIPVLAQMRDIGYHGARIHRHLFPHAVIHGTHGSPQAKHARLLLPEQRQGDGHPELDVPLVLAHLRIRPVRLHDDPKRWVEHLLRLRLRRQLLLRERGSLEARREYWQRVAFGGEATFVCVRRALDLDRVNRREPN